MTQGENPVLVADVGGTNTRVALAQGRALIDGATERFRNAEFDGLEDVLRAYLARHAIRPSRAAIALAGPVQGDHAAMTNLGWQVQAPALAQASGIGHIALLNDLQAQGHAVPYLAQAHLRMVRGAAPAPGTKLVIGLGTGVNAAPVYPLGAGHIVPPAEAGHIHLPLKGAEDYALADWLTERRGFASVEDVLSGAGLERLYAFHTPNQPALDAGAIMTALGARDERAVAVGRHYVRLLAQLAADLALTTLPFGGIYLIGGVARAFGPWLDEFGFEQGFTAMGRFSDLVARFPVAIVEDDFAALAGCAAYLSGQMA
ncbi:MAG: glucokinase [Roseinatronobacter sp.]|nr:glucokinase [Roseinatronobacter sp.]